VRVEIIPQQRQNLYKHGIAQRIIHLVSGLARDDYLAVPQHGKMLAGVGLLQLELLDQLAGRKFPFAKRLDNGDTGGMREALKDPRLEQTQFVGHLHISIFEITNIWWNRSMDKRQRARELAAESLNAGDPTAWFERLYREGLDVVPWAELRPNPNLLPLDGKGKTALVIGCGLGDDAQQLAKWGFVTTAFDISPTAIEKCRERFPESTVRYEVADLLNVPKDWRETFDFVLEIYTVQALPPAIRQRAIEGASSFVKPGGKLLLVARGRDETDPPGELPWPLTRRELLLFTQYGLREESFEDYIDEESVRRFRAVFTR